MKRFFNSQVNGHNNVAETMNLNKRRLIFCTFVYSCAAIGLIGAGLGTRRWVVASARRTSNTTESVGQVNLGLFHGDKYLNIGYGLRTYSVDGECITVLDETHPLEGRSLYGL